MLRAEAVSAGYGGAPIIEDVSVKVHAGKITAIVGSERGREVHPAQSAERGAAALAR